MKDVSVTVSSTRCLNLMVERSRSASAMAWGIEVAAPTIGKVRAPISIAAARDSRPALRPALAAAVGAARAH